MHVTEGGVTIEAPEQPDAGVGDAVFYNPNQEFNRDLTIAALRAFRAGAGAASAPGRGGVDAAPTYCDATAATGIRGVRAAADGWAVTCCDRDPDAVDRCRANLDANGLDGEAVRRDANALLYDRKPFDAVDLDPFGTPVPLLDAALARTRGLVCVTATDTAPLCGAHFDSGVRHYDAVPRNTEYHAEMGVRVLLSACVRTAAHHDVGVTPVLTHATRHYVRTYLAVDRSATAANDARDGLGFVHHCFDCLWRGAERGPIPDPPAACRNCGAEPVTAGPLWVGSTRDPAFVDAARERLDGAMATADRAGDLLTTIGTALDEPTHYDQHECCEQWGRPAAAMDTFLDALRNAGHDASRTQYGGTTFETPASIDEIRAATEGIDR
jgi:tRNA (guanine26-N2/guanine27-N2)-dimethyltransferase